MSDTLEDRNARAVVTARRGKKARTDERSDDVVDDFHRLARLHRWRCDRLEDRPVSARTIKSLHPATWASIQMQNEDESTGHGTQWTCGCSLVQGKVWLCQYHDGYDDGAWALDGDDSTDE